MDTSTDQSKRIKITIKKRRNLKESPIELTDRNVTKPSFYLKDRDKCLEGYEKGKQKSEDIFQFNSGRRKPLMERINVKDKNITPDLFYECLDIYNNNQLVLKSLKMTKININDILKLERWFSSIPEPRDRNDSHWVMREKQRKRDGISYYCDEELRQIILEERERLS